MSLRPLSAGVALGTLIIAGAAIALLLVLRFAQSEADRDSLVWQRQMAVVINSREVALEEWLAEQKKVISRLAENPSLRIYLGNIEVAPAPQDVENLAQAAYLENLMKAAAIQNGYISVLDQDFKIRANLNKQRVSGLALTNPQGQVIVSTPNMPSVIRSVAGFLDRGAGNEVISFGPYLSDDKRPVIAFVAPVFGVQDDNSAPAIGFAVGIKAVPEDFYQKLTQPGDISKTAKNYIVRKNGTAMEYLSPLRMENGDVNSPLTMVLDAESPVLASVFAVQTARETTGGFSERMNYEGKNVLVTGRKIAGTDWVLVRTIDSQEVLGAIQARKRTITWIASLTILAVSILIILIWRHGVSVRVARAAQQQRILSRRYEKLSQFLQIVTDSQPTVITAIDGHGRYLFANAPAAQNTGLKAQDIIGQRISSVKGRLQSPDMENYCNQVMENGTPLSIIEQLPGNEITIKSDYVPLLIDQDQGVLMVTEDISELVRERERREVALKSLVSTLTMVIDSRDPYSAHHSERVAMVSLAIAMEMNADDVTCDTVNIAGALMNLGKILVPRELLVRPKGLSENELETVRSSIMKSADMLETVDFDGPVVKTLRQVRAHWDGSGVPHNLAGHDILLSARIVAVANAFVGMSSARAHRAGMDMEKATLLLLNDADRIYDRKPVTALMNYIENKGGAEQWKEFGIPLAPTDTG
ncbi:hypothetical protein MNBD_ALPHA03-1226 [hydrothermal vent metagenome]|uniref:HD-GYP domain-containing protein n=1 Tax=hydrothermal vent metagenome TaxID=652676 RepID=A0A3B1BA42_9ZZZZ